VCLAGQRAQRARLLPLLQVLRLLLAGALQQEPPGLLLLVQQKPLGPLVLAQQALQRPL
jgi:hypothetical protein